MSPSINTAAFINGQWEKGAGASFASSSPADGKILWRGKETSSAQIDEAAAAAEGAFKMWSQLPVEERAAYLERYKEILKERQDELAFIISEETGKPLWDSKNEVSSMLGKIPLTLESYRARCSEVMRGQPTAVSITRHRPHGVVGVLAPFNFPGHLPGGHIIPALLAGNTVIFKPSELTPLVSDAVMHYWERAELPAGVLNLVQGGKETGQALIRHPGIQGLFFTGSYQTGLFLSQYFGSYPEKILALEMGGNNPLIVSQINDVKASAYLAIQSAYLSSGQRCTCARRLIVPKGKTGDDFIAAFLEMAKTIVTGRPTDRPEPFMGPVITEKQALKLLESQAFLQSKGGRPLLEMKSSSLGISFLSPGLMDVTGVKELPDEENFGPFLQLIRPSNFIEAVKEANKTRFGLAAGLFSSSEEEYRYFYEHVRAGIVNWNMQLTGASSAAPFGGVGCSGNHRPSAYYAVDYCAYPVASIETPQITMPAHLHPGINF